MDPQVLAHIEEASQLLYTGNTANASVQALVSEYKDVGCLANCQAILEHSSSPYAQLMAASSLFGLVTNKYTALDLQQRLHMRNFVINFLWTKPTTEAVVLNNLMQMLARLTKYGWFDQSGDVYVFRDVPEELFKFIQGQSVSQWTAGVGALTSLVSEFNRQGNIRSYTLQRKLAAGFKEHSLLSIYEFGLSLLRRVAMKEIPIADSESERFCYNVLELQNQCLGFDFIGTAVDESVDDIGTVEVPASWKKSILEMGNLEMFFDLYAMLSAALQPKVLEVLVNLAAVKRPLFSPNEKTDYFTRFARLVSTVLSTQLGLSNQECFHQVCRMLSRLRLWDLGNTLDEETFNSLLRLTAVFTMTSVKAWQWTANSIEYLLTLWDKMASAMPMRTKQSQTPQIVDEYAPKITEEYLSSRLASVEIVIQNGLDVQLYCNQGLSKVNCIGVYFFLMLDASNHSAFFSIIAKFLKSDTDPLEDREMLMAQLEKLAPIARKNYEGVWQYISASLDNVAQQYQDNLATASPEQLEILEKRLAWLVYVIAAIIGGRAGTMNVGQSDAMDAELACKVVALLRLQEGRMSKACEDIEHATIAFFRQFCKIYIGANVQKSSKIFTQLGERLGLNDQLMVLDLFVQKIASNLKIWVNSEEIIESTVQLLSELSVGYSTVRMLLKLQSIQYILVHHSAGDFPFLGVPRYLKLRTSFFTCLGRMLFANIEAGVEDGIYDDFMTPSLETAVQLSSLFEQATDEQLVNNNEAKFAVMGLARELRGLVAAANNRSTYILLFDTLHPQVVHVFLRAVAIWTHDLQLTQAVMKFMFEFVQNKNKRIEFDVASANGILLFRATSNILAEYANTADEQNRRCRGATMFMRVLYWALAGKYVNYGVFRLYGDDALEKVLNAFLMLIHAIPLQELLAYPKLALAYYQLVQILAEDHVDFIAGLDPPGFHYIMASMLEGLGLKEVKNAVCACVVLDNILSHHLKYVLKQSNKAGYTRTKLSYLLESCSEMLPKMLEHMLQVVVFEDCQIYWTISRPMMCLILLNEQYYLDMSSNFIGTQAPERQAVLKTIFDGLMLDIDRSLTQKNREQFTKNVNQFRRDITSHIKAPSPPANAVSNDMMGDAL